MNSVERFESVLALLSDGKPLLIAGLGDSLTEGWMVSSGFFDQFIGRLQSRFSAPHIRSMNAGVPGDTASGGLARLGVILEKNPDLVTVQFGINDMYMGVSPRKLGQTLERILRDVEDSDAAALLIVSCPLKWGADERQSAPYYAEIRRLGDRMGVPVADLELFWKQNTTGWDGLIQADGVHPTDAGHSLMADGLLALFPLKQ